MMSSENIPPPATAEMQTASGNRKTPSQQRAQQPAHEQEQPLKCPRCDSANTKFCYYNNYSLSQPRHFCKTCRRYWTKGGALRNVPIGGGCRKTKKLKPSSTAAVSAASRLLSSLDPAGSEFGSCGFKFLSPTAPAMEFQLGGLSLPRLHPATAGVYTQFVTGGGGPPGCFGQDLLGLNYPTPNSSGSGNNNTTTSPSVVQPDHHQFSLSSIESLSSINQEMHWKLQQQRLALIYGNPTVGDNHDHDHHDNRHQDGNHDDRHQILKPKEKPPTTAMNLFQNFEINNNNNHLAAKITDVETANINGDHHRHHQDHHHHHRHHEEHIMNSGDGSRKLEVGPTEWFFDQTTYTTHPPSNNTSTTNGATNGIETTGNHMNGVQAAAFTTTTWGDLHQFNGLQ